MEWLLLAVALGGGGGLGWTRWQRRVAERREQAADLDVVRRLADEDVTVLGEQLRRLDERVAGSALSVEAQHDYQTALDAYESAGRAVGRLRHADEVSSVTDTLSHGRYAMACVEARVAGRTPQPWKPPCFFDPRHGPSVTAGDVDTAGSRHPPCAPPARRRGARRRAPAPRRAHRGAPRRLVPYWQAGAATAPYTEGYFTGAAGMAWAWAVVTPPSVGGDPSCRWGAAAVGTGWAASAGTPAAGTWVAATDALDAQWRGSCSPAVPQARVELATFRLGGGCSIH